MKTIDHAQKRLAAVIKEIDRLKQSDFAYLHSFDALNILEKKFKNQAKVLEKASPTEPATQNACSTSLYQLHLYLPILGFILRSTNVRNAFEVYAPLLRLAKKILGSDTKLILSSEWDFSPFVYRSITDLPGFVLIGLPASESANPLLIPSAGHEIGHSVWNSKNFPAKFSDRIKKIILDELTNERWSEYSKLYPQYTKSDINYGNLFASPTWIPAYTWALLQIEEIFCDFFGLRLFGESYFHAFEYLISPGTPGERSLQYPKITNRVSHIVRAAERMSVDIPSGFKSCFMAESEPIEPTIKLLISIADTASDYLVTDLIDLTIDFAKNKKIPIKNPERVSCVYETFCNKVMPTPNAESIVDILNAGWKCNLDHDLWNKVPQINQKDKNRILRDLMLKSMEVLEIHERLRKLK